MAKEAKEEKKDRCEEIYLIYGHLTQRQYSMAMRMIRDILAEAGVYVDRILAYQADPLGCMLKVYSQAVTVVVTEKVVETEPRD